MYKVFLNHAFMSTIYYLQKMRIYLHLLTRDTFSCVQVDWMELAHMYWFNGNVNVPLHEKCQTHLIHVLFIFNNPIPERHACT